MWFLTDKYLKINLNSPRLGEQVFRHGQEFHLMIRIVCSSVRHIGQDFRAAQTIAVRNGDHSLGTEGSIRINVQAFSIPTANVQW